MKHTWDGFFTNCDKNLINKRLRIVHKPIKNGQIFINNQVYIDFQSNDYLGLSKNISLIEAAHNGLEVYGVGSTGAASLSGYTEEHFLLQQEIANWLEYDNCLLFNSGYQMNFSLFQQLVNSMCTYG